jgi:hypothetical protein
MSIVLGGQDERGNLVWQLPFSTRATYHWQSHYVSSCRKLTRRFLHGLSVMQPVLPMEVVGEETADQVVLDLVAVTSAVTETSGEEVVVEEDMVAAAVGTVVEVMAAAVVVDMVAAMVEVQLVPGTK